MHAEHAITGYGKEINLHMMKINAVSIDSQNKSSDF